MAKIPLDIRPLEKYIKETYENDLKKLDKEEKAFDNRRKGSELFETTDELISHIRRRSSLKQGVKEFHTLGEDIQSFAKHTKQPEGLEEKKKNRTGAPGEQGEGPVTNECEKGARNNACMKNGCGEPTAITFLKGFSGFLRRDKADKK